MTKNRGQTPVVNHMSFTDARPTIGSKSATFNPGAASNPLPNGPPRYISVKGKSPRQKGETNKRINDNL